MIQIDETKLSNGTIEMIGIDCNIKPQQGQLYLEYIEYVIKELKNANKIL